MSTQSAATLRKVAVPSPTERVLSWGRYPKTAHQRVHKPAWNDQVPDILRSAGPGSLLPYGLGRSYGDSCLNAGRELVDCRRLNRILGFDETTGMMRCESGVSFADIIDVFLPKGWFLPVTPGTRFVTVGGAIANDVHGKNHHCAGTFTYVLMALAAFGLILLLARKGFESERLDDFKGLNERSPWFAAMMLMVMFTANGKRSAGTGVAG